MGIEINPIYLVSALLVWVLIYHLVYSFFTIATIARDSSLICWSVGPLGISVVQLREPPFRQTLAQFAAAAAALALAVYGSLFLLHPSPVSGLDTSPERRLVAVVLPVVLIVGTHLLLLLREYQFPLWGEARVLARVQRSLARGGRVIFTPAGRTFVRERFGATTAEFLRMVR